MVLAPQADNAPGSVANKHPLWNAPSVIGICVRNGDCVAPLDCRSGSEHGGHRRTGESGRGGRAEISRRRCTLECRSARPGQVFVSLIDSLTLLLVLIFLAIIQRDEAQNCWFEISRRSYGGEMYLTTWLGDSDPGAQ